MNRLPTSLRTYLFLLATVASLEVSAATLPSGFDPDGYTSLGGLSLSGSDVITIDTDTGVMSGSANHVSTTAILDSDGGQYKAFVFDDISIGAGVTVSVSGSLGVAFLSQDDLFFGADMSVAGSDAADAVADQQDGADGGEGGSIALVADDYLKVDGTLSVTGGAGGEGGPDVPGDHPGNGGNGGDAGSILLAAPRMQLNGALMAAGGEDGDVGDSTEEPFADSGQGGDGGLILICNDFITTADTEVREGSEFTNNFQSTEGIDGSVTYAATASFLLPEVWYVDADRSGLGAQDGVSWATAFADLQDALASASEGDQVWVADGVYYPDEAEASTMSGASVTNDAESSVFEINSGIYVLGGFSGSEAEVGLRDALVNISILSGDIDHETNPDTMVNHVIVEDPHNAIVGTNADTVVYGLRYVSADMRLDGFTITAGDSSNFGGGFYGAGHIENCIIQGNYGNNVGGVLPIDGYLLTIVDSSVVGNSGLYVGGIYAYNPQLEMLRCRIQGNRSVSADGADAGGARFLLGDVSFTDCLISGNYGGSTGGVSYALGNHDGESSFVLNGCTVVGNYAHGTLLIDGYAGGIDAGNRVDLDIRNSLIWGNEGNANANLVGHTSIAYSIVEGLDLGGGNLDGTDVTNAPDFVEPIIAMDAPTMDGDLRLYGNSASVNAGDDSLVTGAFDLSGRNRSIGSSVDMGAFEYNGPSVQSTLSSFTLDVDAVIGYGRIMNIAGRFNNYDSLLFEYSHAGVATETMFNSIFYRFAGIGEGGDSTDVSVFAVDDTTGDRARIVFTITLIDTYTVEDYRAENGMDVNGADDGEDFSGNGVPNLLQYVAGETDAYATNIASVDFDTQQAGLPKYETDASGNVFIITYSEPSNETSAGINNRLRESTDLSSWGTVSSGGESGPSIRTVETADDYTIYEVTVSMNQDQNFYRIEAEYDRSFEGLE